MTIGLNDLPTVKVGSEAFEYKRDTRSVAAGATEGADVLTYDSLIPISIHGPLWIFISGAGSGGLTITTKLELNGVTVETITGLAVTGGQFYKIGPRSIDETTASQGSIATTLPLHWSLGTARLKVYTRVTVNTRSGSTTIAVEGHGHDIRTDLTIDEYQSMSVYAVNVGGKTSADAGNPFTIASVSGRGRLFGPVTVRDSISGGSGSRQFTLRVDGVDIMVVGPNAFNASFRYHGLGIISPNYTQNSTNDLGAGVLQAHPPNIEFLTGVELIAEIVSLSGGQTADFHGGFYAGLFTP